MCFAGHPAFSVSILSGFSTARTHPGTARVSLKSVAVELSCRLILLGRSKCVVPCDTKIWNLDMTLEEKSYQGIYHDALASRVLLERNSVSHHWTVQQTLQSNRSGQVHPRSAEVLWWKLCNSMLYNEHGKHHLVPANFIKKFKRTLLGLTLMAEAQLP